MRRRNGAIFAAALVVAAAAVGAALALRGGGPSRAKAADCHGLPRLVSHASLPSAMLAALPVLARKASGADAVPRRGIAELAFSSGTGLDPRAARLIRSDDTGKAWVVPILHDAPQVPSETVACVKAQVSASDRIALQGPTATERQMIARVTAIDRLNARRAAHAPPGVLVYAQGELPQTGSATLAQLRAGTAYTTGECAGPGHNLLTVSGLAPAPTATVELDAAGGSSQKQPVPREAYSFLLAPTSLPDRLVLRDSSGKALHTIAIPPARFSLRAHCSYAAPGRPEEVPAGYTVIASSPSSPYSYLVAVSSSGNPACAPDITVFSHGESGTGASSCNSYLHTDSLVPTFSGGGFSAQQAEINGQVSTRVKRLRLVASGGRTLTIPVFAVPEWISHDYGIIYAVGPSDVLTANPLVEALGSNGAILSRSHALSHLQHAGRNYPVKQLPPGRVTLASLNTADGPAWFTLHRIFYFGHVSLCFGAAFDTGNSQTCANYPVGRKSNQGIGNAPLWLIDAGPGPCGKPARHVVAGILLRSGLTAWLHTPQGTRRMSSVAIPAAFHVSGPLIYGAIASGADAIIVRNAAGATVYTRPAIGDGVSFGSCLHLPSPN